MCPSCNENAYSEIAPELGPRRMTKYSLSESLLAPQLSELQKQYSEIILSYHKLKISFTVMLVLNAILLVLVITCMVFIIPNITAKSEDKPNGEQTYVPTPRTGAIIRDPNSLDSVTTMVGRTVVNCQSIREKLGKLYMKGQKVDNINGKTCSMEDLIDSFVQVTIYDSFLSIYLIISFDRHDITELLLKVALNTIKHQPISFDRK
jgi:hypothetical protein